MKYIDYTAYKKLNSKINKLNWVIYLPAKQGPSETSGNSSLLNNAIKMLKETLHSDGTRPKTANKIINNLRDKQKDFMLPLKGNSVAVLVYKNGLVEVFELPLSIESGYITDVKEYFLAPIEEFYKQDQSYYFLELHQNGCQLYEWDINGIKLVNDAELAKALPNALMLDEAHQKSIQTRHLSGLNSGLSEGIHGQGGYKDKRKELLKEYLMFIDKQLSTYSKAHIKPIVLVGSKQLSGLFKNISHNKRLIKGYVNKLPNKLDLASIENMLAKA